MMHLSPLIKVCRVESETRSEMLMSCVVTGTSAPGHIRLVSVCLVTETEISCSWHLTYSSCCVFRQHSFGNWLHITW